MTFHQRNPSDGSLRVGSASEDALAVDATADLTRLRGVGAKAGATVTVKESVFGSLHQTVLTLVDTPVEVVSVTTGAGVGGTKVYDFPQAHIAVIGCSAVLSIAIAEADEGDFTDGTPEGQIGIGTVAPANADALGTDATDDDFGTAADFTMSDYVDSSVVIAPDAIAKFDGSGTAIDAFVNVLVDAGDIDDGTTTNVNVSGTITFNWVKLS